MRARRLFALGTVGILMALPARSQQQRLQSVSLLSNGAWSGLPSAFSVDGRLFAIGTPAGAIEVWDVAKGNHLETIAAPPNTVLALAFTPDSRLAYSSGSAIRIVDLITHSTIPLAGDWKDVSSFAISRDNIAWTKSQTTRVQVRPLTIGPVSRSFVKHSSRVLGMSFSPDGSKIVTGEFYRVARMWSIRTSCVQQNFPNRSSSLHGIHFSPDGRWLSVTSDSSIQISDTVSGQEVKRFLPDSGAFVASAFSADGSLVAITDDMGLRLWRSDPLPFLAHVPKPKPALHIVVVGINSYRNPKLHLGYAQQDASDIAAFFEQHSEALSWEPRSVRVLGDCATKDEIRSVLDQISKDARPEDALLVYLAGHGKQEGSDFYYFPFDMPMASTGPVSQWGFSASELGTALQKIQARKQVMILDACQSGAAITAIKEAVLRSAPTARSLHILSASASTEEAMEIEELGHGVLTSVLLGQLQKAAESPRGGVAALLARVAQNVPGLAATYNKSGLKSRM